MYMLDIIFYISCISLLRDPPCLHSMCFGATGGLTQPSNPQSGQMTQTWSENSIIPDHSDWFRDGHMIKRDQSESSPDVSAGHYGNNVLASFAVLGCAFIIAPSCIKETI